MRGTRTASLLVLALLAALLINLPLVHSAWRDWTVERNGVDVTARAEGLGVADDGEEPTYRVQFTLTDDETAGGSVWPVVVDESTYDEVQRTGTVRVRVVEDEPGLHTVDGEVRGRGMLVLTVVADLVLLLMVVLAWRHRGRLRPQLRLLATEDVRRCPPGAELERLEGERYVVSGDVLEIEDDALLLDLGDRTVKVLLDGHHNPVGYQQPARVTGVLIG